MGNHITDFKNESNGWRRIGNGGGGDIFDVILSYPYWALKTFLLG
jgi:hypothetical protein